MATWPELTKLSLGVLSRRPQDHYFRPAAQSYESAGRRKHSTTAVVSASMEQALVVQTEPNRTESNR